MDNDSKKIIVLYVIVIAIIGGLIFFGFIKNKEGNKTESNTQDETSNNINDNVKPDELGQENDIGPINLKIGKTTDITGGRLVEINDYEIVIPDKLVKIGYTINVENNILTIKSNDNNYKFIMYQLTDNYKAPAENELEKFDETEDVKKLEKQYDNDEIDFLEYLDRYDKLQLEYLKKIGYTAKDSPDYILTEEELAKISAPYMKDGESTSSGCSGLFPGDKCYAHYSWGKNTTYSIPKVEITETFGKNESDFAAYIEIFEYYDENIVDYDIELWTL